MEEIKYKLKTNNSVLVVNAFEKLISIIVDKFNAAERNKDFVYKNEELIYLREKCSDPHGIVSLTACQGVLSLVEMNVLEISQTISTITALLPTARNYVAIISTMSGLLLLSFKRQLRSAKVFKNQLGLKAPQHPFITILEKNIETADDILSQMQAICQSHDNMIAQNSVEILRPVFLWLVCNPMQFHNEWRQKAWQLIYAIPELLTQRELIVECLSWQQLTLPKHSQAAFQACSLFATHAREHDYEYLSAILPIVAKISSYHISQGYDPRPCYNFIESCLAQLKKESVIASLIIMLLSRNVSSTPSLYLLDLFRVCRKIIEQAHIESVAQSMLISQTLQWLYYPSKLTSEALKEAEKLVVRFQKKENITSTKTDDKTCDKMFQILIHSDSDIALHLELLKLWINWRDDESMAENWLDSIDKYALDTKTNMADFLLGVFTCCDLEKVTLKCLEIILKLVKSNKELSAPFLPILIYRLANPCSAEVKVQCLKAVPLMAISKENVPKIVAFLNKMKHSKSVPTSMLIHCYCSLALIEDRCFPYLQEVLTEKNKFGGSCDVAWEVEMAKMGAIVKMCENSNHAAQLAGVISSGLSGKGDPTVAASAVRAARALTKAVNTLVPYDALPKSPKAAILQASICDLLGEVPVGLPDTVETAAIIKTCLRMLWNYVAEAAEPQVIERACKALSCYKLEDMSLKDLPSIYHEGVGLPPEFCKTPIDAARNPVDVLEYVPAEVWPNVFKNTNQSALEGVKQLCSMYISREIQAFRSGIYSTNAVRGEPTNMTYLSNKSVLRGLMEFIRTQAVHPSYDCPPSALAAMLECVALEYCRPLPPMSLAHLPELASRINLCLNGALTLGARQALIAESARNYIDTYLVDINPETCTASEAEMIFKLLPILCRNVRPNILRKFIDKFIEHHYLMSTKTKQEDGDDSFCFVDIWSHIATALCDEKIHDANRTSMTNVVKNYFGLITVGSKVWPTYAQTCSHLSSDSIECLTSPTSWWETTTEVIRKSTDIRSIIACTNRSLVWLNEILDAVLDYKSEHTFVLSRLSACLLVCSSSDESMAWFMQLLARTQVAFNSESSNTHGIEFLCHCVCLAAVILSGIGALHLEFLIPEHNSKSNLRDVYGAHLLKPLSGGNLPITCDKAITLFPIAIASIVKLSPMDDQTKIVEWLHHSRGVDRISSAMKTALHLALIESRSCAHYRNVWTKILSVNPPYTL